MANGPQVWLQREHPFAPRCTVTYDSDQTGRKTPHQTERADDTTDQTTPSRWRNVSAGY